MKLVLMYGVSFGYENCLKEQKKSVCSEKLVQDKVDWSCHLLNSKGEQAAFSEIRKMRYECCGEPDYVWVMGKNLKMWVEPIQSQLEEWENLKSYMDQNQRPLYREFLNEAEKTKKGAWIIHHWTRIGDADPSKRKTWVKECLWKDKNNKIIQGVIGSGSWM